MFFEGIFFGAYPMLRAPTFQSGSWLKHHGSLFARHFLLKNQKGAKPLFAKTHATPQVAAVAHPFSFHTFIPYKMK
jgi:hypothetical protein